jgi:hypothetical protein
MQPFVYPSGLVEIPIAPAMDVSFFRSRKWKLVEYLAAVEACVKWAIENRAIDDWGTHPAIMYVEDPEFKTIDLTCNLVNAAGDKAAIVGWMRLLHGRSGCCAAQLNSGSVSNLQAIMFPV